MIIMINMYLISQKNHLNYPLEDMNLNDSFVRLNTY